MVVNKPPLFVQVPFQEVVLSWLVCNSPASLSLHFTGRDCGFLPSYHHTHECTARSDCDAADTYSWSGQEAWQTLSSPAESKMDLHSFQINSLITVMSSQWGGGWHWFLNSKLIFKTFYLVLPGYQIQYELPNACSDYSLQHCEHYADWHISNKMLHSKISH